RLQHPNIVQVHEFGEWQGQPYLVLEFVDGGSLAEWAGGRPQSARAAAELVETLARAMAYAHSRGVMHRDLKPSNILLAACGLAGGVPPTPPAKPQAAKITDFGLAKELDRDSGQTRSGTV